MTELLTVKTGEYIDTETALDALEFPYELDNFQKHGANSIEHGHHIIVTAHTGSGKTSVGEYAIAYHIKRNKRIIYTTPIKALSNQIHKNLSNKYKDWDIGIKTGDIEVNANAQVVIMTTEILRNALFQKDSPILEHLGCVIFDEVHWIKDRDRGHVWEETIISLPAEIQMVMLSATIPDADKFGIWIANTKSHPVDLIPTTHRVVPLTHYVMASDKLYQIMDNHRNFNTDNLLKAQQKFEFRPSMLNEYIVRLKDKLQMLPAFFFCFSRDKCETYAKSITVSLIDGKTSIQIGKLFDKYISKFGERYTNMMQTKDVRNLLIKGVCFHHSGLMHVLKEIIELIFSEGLIKVLFVTETFAAGVNMPARTVVFTGLQKYDGYLGELRYLHPEEYSQMAGRAGRRGLDKKGNVILLPFHHSERLNPSNLKTVMAGKMADISSRFKIDYSFVLKVIYANHEGDIINLVEYAKKSLLNRQAERYLKSLEEEYAVMKERFEGLSSLTDEHPNYELIMKYYRLTEQPGKLSRNKIGKQIRTVKNTVNKFSEGEKREFYEKVEQHKEYLIHKKELEKMEMNIDYQHHYLEHAIYLILRFLNHLGYLNKLHDRDAETFIYQREDLSLKGIVAAGINECDPIMFTEILTSDGLNKLDTAEIISVLGFFVDERETDREYKINKNVYFVMNDINEIIHNLEVVGSKLGLSEFDIVPDWHISKESVDLAYIWTSGGSVNEIYSLSTEIYEGNFVRNVLKLRSLCESAIRVCELTHDDLLAKKLENYEELLVRSIVTPESLYVKVGM